VNQDTDTITTYSGNNALDGSLTKFVMGCMMFLIFVVFGECIDVRALCPVVYRLLSLRNTVEIS